MRTETLVGADRTRLRVQGLILAHALVQGSVSTRDLSDEQAEMAAWAVQQSLQDTTALLHVQTEGV